MILLNRFIIAQSDSYATALAELEKGCKKTEWMWFIFPQIKGLGRSSTSRLYAIADQIEAQAYLDHSILGERLRKSTEAIQAHASMKSAQDILGRLDAMKFHSSMTLFSAVSEEEIWSRTIDIFFNGNADPITLRLMNQFNSFNARRITRAS